VSRLMALVVLIVSAAPSTAADGLAPYQALMNSWLTSQPCRASDWKTLPNTISRPTLFLGRCVRIDGPTKVGGQKLVVLARELEVTNKAAINAVGDDGDTGKKFRGQNNDGQIDIFPNGKANSTDRCLCGTKPYLYGGEGSPGKPGGDVRFVARVARAAAGASIVIGGGLKGDHGECGIVDCPKYPEHSPPCCDPNYSRTRSESGTTYFALGGPQADTTLQVLAAGVDTMNSPAPKGKALNTARKLDADVAFVAQALDDVRDANAASFDVVELK
jgi:hypothetical protein